MACLQVYDSSFGHPPFWNWVPLLAPSVFVCALLFFHHFFFMIIESVFQSSAQYTSKRLLFWSGTQAVQKVLMQLRTFLGFCSPPHTGIQLNSSPHPIIPDALVLGADLQLWDDLSSTSILYLHQDDKRRFCCDQCLVATGCGLCPVFSCWWYPAACMATWAMPRNGGNMYPVTASHQHANLRSFRGDSACNSTSVEVAAPDYSPRGRSHPQGCFFLQLPLG